jgi:hypothetical protein
MGRTAQNLYARNVRDIRRASEIFRNLYAIAA